MLPSPKTVTIATFIGLSTCFVIPGCQNAGTVAPTAPAILTPAKAAPVPDTDWVGRSVEPFTLPDSQGKSVSLKESLGKQPVVLIFYRGNWCPFCHAQMAEIAAAKNQLTASGAKVYAISNEKADALQTMRSRHKLDWVTFLSDADGVAAKQFAGTYPGEATLKPVTLVIGKNGKVLYAYTNEDYTRRATTQAVLEAIDK